MKEEKDPDQVEWEERMYELLKRFSVIVLGFFVWLFFLLGIIWVFRVI